MRHLLPTFRLALGLSVLSGCFAGAPASEHAVGEACSDNSGCKAGTLCINRLCMQTCQTDFDCPKAEKCTNDVCAAGGGKCGTDEGCVTPPSSCYQAVGCLAGECRYVAKAVGGDCTVGGDRGPCAADVGSCDAGNVCVPAVLAGKACTTPGPHGSCAAAAGVCNPSGDCVYAKAEAGTACAGSDLCRENYRCDAVGDCVGDPVVCDTPPALSCASADTILSYEIPGVCTGGACWYEPFSAPCKVAGTCVGSMPACLGNPCSTANITCPAEPCTTGVTCYQGYCAYQDVTVPTLCDANGDGVAMDGVCGSARVCDPNVCLVANAVVSRGARNPTEDCWLCDPDFSRGGWASLPVGEPCKTRLGTNGVCGQVGMEPVGCSADVCVVGGFTYSRGGNAAGSSCLVCAPETSRSSLTLVADYGHCASPAVGLCIGGLCQDVCRIGGATYNAGAREPGNACRECDPTRDAYNWLPLAATAQACMTPTSVVGLCSSGTCAQQCYINGVYYPSGTAGPGGCGVCDPSRGTGVWSAVADNTPCAAGYCRAGTCALGCLIGGVFYAPGAIDGATNCQTCDAKVATPALTSWTPKTNGVGCVAPGSAAVGICINGGACDPAACFIGGVRYSAGDFNGANLCQKCVVSAPSGWTALNGDACGAGLICSSGTCKTGLGQACLSHAACASNHCECADPNCGTRVCAASACSCKYDASGGCTTVLNEGAQDVGDCEYAANQSCQGGVCAARVLTFEGGVVPPEINNVGGWGIDSSTASQGTKSFKGPFETNGCFEITATNTSGSVSFDIATSNSSISFYDGLVGVGYFSGNLVWQSKSFAVSAGLHTFKWCGTSGHVSPLPESWVDNIKVW